MCYCDALEKEKCIINEIPGLSRTMILIWQQWWLLGEVWFSAAWLINCETTCSRYQKSVFEFVVLLP